MTLKESHFPQVQSSCVFTSTHLWQTAPSGREYMTHREMSQALRHLSLVSSSSPPLQVLLAYMHHLYLQHVLATQRIPLPFVIDWSFSAIIGPYCNLEATQRFSKLEDSEPRMLSQHSLSVR